MLDFLITFIRTYGLVFLFVIIFGGCATYIIMEGRKKDFSRRTYQVLGFFLILLPALVFVFIEYINPNYLGYGYSIEGSEMPVHEGDALWASDSRTTSGGNTGESGISYRVQGIDLNSGAKLFRKNIDDEFKVAGHHDQIVWVPAGKDINGIHIRTGDNFCTLNEALLMSTFPELAMGVSEFKFNTHTSLFDIVSKDGLTFSIDPVLLKKTTADSIPTPKETEESPIDLNRELRQKLINTENEIINDQLFFLEGKIISYDSVSKNTIFLSYETLDKTNFLIRCITPAGNLVWQDSQEDLKVGDFFEAAPRYTTSFFYAKNVIICFEGFIFSLDATNGKLNWLTRV